DRRPAGFGLWRRDVLLVPGLADNFAEPTEQRVAAAAVISITMVSEVTIDHSDDVRESNSTRLPVSRDTPKLERWAKSMPAVQIADPTAVSVEIDIINRGHRFILAESAEAISRSAAPTLRRIVDRPGDEICQ